jgi:hypothetical protein
MDELNEKKWNMWQNAAHRLNADAYFSMGKKYQPCPKSEVYMRACGNPGKLTLNQVTEEASLTHCVCHNSWGLIELRRAEEDDGYRLAHYKGDLYKLYK